MCLRVSCYKKYGHYFAVLKSLKKGVGSRAGSGSGSGALNGSIREVKRIRTKMSGIPNTASRAPYWLAQLHGIGTIQIHHQTSATQNQKTLGHWVNPNLNTQFARFLVLFSSVTDLH
jgi:hypothetical protein